MEFASLPVASPALVVRDLPDPTFLADPRAFAWEIVRRRADYRGAVVAVERIGPPEKVMMLIAGEDGPDKWGLRFRRLSSARCVCSAPHVGPPPGFPYN